MESQQHISKYAPSTTSSRKVSAYPSEKTRKTLIEHKKITGISVSETIEVAIKEYFDRHPKDSWNK